MLASASPARRRLLQQALIPHQVMVSGVDESSFHHNDPSHLVLLLAQAKASAVLNQLADKRSADLFKDEIKAVLGCDSVFEFEGEIFGKPLDAVGSRGGSSGCLWGACGALWPPPTLQLSGSRLGILRVCRDRRAQPLDPLHGSPLLPAVTFCALA